MKIRLTVFSLTVFLGLCPAASAQNIDLSDVGTVYLENTGSIEAQQAFLHGLAQLHNFEYGFAAADFQQAQKIDPNFALAYWGEAMTHNLGMWKRQDKDSALTALNKYASSPAARQDKAPSELARDLLAAVDILYGDGSKNERDDLYREKMADLYTKYPDNVEIATFYALSIMGSAHDGRNYGDYMQVAAMMQNLRSAYPRHPGVAHYLIHATDDPTHAPLGLEAAKAYGGIAPIAGHAQHMTTHIFLAFGDWDGVIAANILAVSLTDVDRAENGLGPLGCGHYHNWLMYGFLQQGRRDEAHDIMTLCYENVSEQESYIDFFATQRALYLRDTSEWQGDVAKMEIDHRGHAQALLVDRVTDGVAALHNENIPAARAALVSAKEALETLQIAWDNNGVSQEHSSRALPLVSLKQLEAQIALATGATELGLELLHEAVSIEMGLPYGYGPPEPEKPSLELLGETLLAMERFSEASEILETNLTRTPNKAVSVSALAATETALANAN